MSSDNCAAVSSPKLTAEHTTSVFCDMLLSIDTLRQTLAFDEALFHAAFDTHRLHSVFQPIVGLCHERVVGHEALLRPTLQGTPYSPEQLFGDSRSLTELIRLDRTARLLHAVNFSLYARESNWLFLNVHPQVFIHGHRFGPFFKQMLACAGLPAERVVIEVLESASEDEARFAEGVMYYRQLGCLIALDDFGASHSNIDRLLRIHPDIVKFDHSLLQRATTDSGARRLLAKLVALLHEAGIMVVVEGIETFEQALIALDADADFGQGYLFGRPESLLHIQEPACDFERLNHSLQQSLHKRQGETAVLQHIIALFRDAAFRCEGDEALASAALALLACDKVERVYLLDGEGRELESILANGTAATRNMQLAPLLNTRGANWSRRPYFRRAISAPRSVQITAPYRAINTQLLCRTLSITIEQSDGWRVLCCDIEWEED